MDVIFDTQYLLLSNCKNFAPLNGGRATIQRVLSLSVRSSFLIVLVVRRSLMVCAVSPQFGVAAYLRGMEDRARLQMIAQVRVAQASLGFADILRRRL